jgi:CO/xanthine dehydrogenase FAD-binding subunit
VAVTLQAMIVVRDASGPAEMPAEELYLGPMITALPERGVLTRVRFPIWPQARVGAAFHEVSARASDFAFVAAAAQVALDEEGRCTALAAGVGGAGDTPVRLGGLDEALVGSRLDGPRVREAVEATTAGLETVDDLHASAAYRKRVAATLARRAILDAAAEAAGRGHAG